MCDLSAVSAFNFLLLAVDRARMPYEGVLVSTRVVKRYVVRGRTINSPIMEVLPTGLAIRVRHLRALLERILAELPCAARSL